jgi:hypothetical protein
MGRVNELFQSSYQQLWWAGLGRAELERAARAGWSGGRKRARMFEQNNQPGAGYFVSSRPTPEPACPRGKSRQRRDRSEAKPDPGQPTTASEEP